MDHKESIFAGPVMTDRWPALMSKKDAAAYIGVSPSQFDRMLMAGELTPKRISERRIGIRRADLDAFIESLPDHKTSKQKDAMRPRTQQKAK